MNRKGHQISIDFSSNSSFVELPSFGVRQEMGKAVDNSNRPVGNDKQGGFHEEGGIFGKLANGEEKVVHAKPGEYANPMYSKQAGVDVNDALNPEEQGILKDVNGSFHVHPAGTVSDTRTENGRSITDTHGFNPNPSDFDRNNTKTDNNFVLSPRNNKATIYGKDGKTKATFPLDKLKSVNNEPKK